MTSTVIPFPRLNVRALSAASAAVADCLTSELEALERFTAVTGRALDELRITEKLIGRASQALESGDIDDMIAARDLLAERIDRRRADHERRATPARSAAR